MKCPECGKEMRLKETTIWHSNYDQIDWDELEPWSETQRTHTCKGCKIKYEENEDKWEIPEGFLPTEKQIKCAEWISNVLHVSFPIPTKKELWKFIKTNIDAANKAHDQYMDDFYEENFDWMEEPF